MTPNSALVYMTSTHREALAGLRYAILAEKGFTLLTGDAGTGKTTLISRLLTSLPERVKVFVILNPVLQPDEFLEYMMLQMGIKEIPASKAQRLTMLQNSLQETDRNGEIPVLIIDEAHKLRIEVLEEIRLLGNFETPNKKLLQIILAGQSELCDLLNDTNLRQLKQRIAVRLSIQPLAATQVAEYIAYRWHMSGARDVHPFLPDALAAIARYAKGIPRVVNAICDNALVLTVAEGKTAVDESMIVAVCRDLDLLEKTHLPVTIDFAPRVVEAPVAKTSPESAVLPPVPVRRGTMPDGVFGSVITPFRTLQRYETSTKRSLLMRCAAKIGFVH